MATETLTSAAAAAWPALGNPPPGMSLPTDENPEQWEMISEQDENVVYVLPDSPASDAVEVMSGRPRSATVGGPGDVVVLKRNSKRTASFGTVRSLIRRCSSTPDLMVADNAHDIIVEDESDGSSEDAEFVDAGAFPRLEESFEVVKDGRADESEEIEGEHVMIDEDSKGDDSATLVSTPSVGTSSWTMASPSGGAWGPVTGAGMNKTPSFAEMLARNIPNGQGEWGKNKEETEARLRDSHRKHRIRVRTKPKFIVTDGGSGAQGVLKHAHSTGDLNNLASRSAFGRGRGRCLGKQLSAMTEEDEEGDFVIRRGTGKAACSGGGCGDILGETDAIDYYSRKEKGGRSTRVKKKERPDEAKRREISVKKKDMQRKMQAEKGLGGGTCGGKKKPAKSFGGKKERRRL